MSLGTWKAEFYPVPADKVPKEEATQHSLTKWRGALPENLEKHGVILACGTVIDNEGRELTFDGMSCSLCQSCLLCELCPLENVRGGVPCVFTRKDEDDPPFQEMSENNNPVPMIEWLEKALAYERANNPRIVQ